MAVFNETLALKGELEELQRCSAWISEAAGKLELPHDIAFSLELCCEEAISNIILYGLADVPASEREVLIRLAHEGGALDLVIEDKGIAFDPTAAPDHRPPEDLDHAKIGGLGIVLLRKFTHGMSYERRNDRNHLELKFSLSPA